MHAPGAREEEAAVGRDGVLVAEQVLEHRDGRASGWMPCETWASCCGSPSSTRLRAQVPTASASASDIWPASSTNSVSTRPSMSSRANSHAVPATSSTSSVGLGEVAPGSRRSSTNRLLVVVALLQPAERDALVARRPLDLVEQVVDRLVAGARSRRRAGPARSGDDQPRARVGLARAGRPLDEEVARVERPATIACAASRSSCGSGARCRAERAAVALEDRLERADSDASPASTERAEPPQRRLLRLGVVRRRRGSASAAADRPRLRAAAQPAAFPRSSSID